MLSNASQTSSNVAKHLTKTMSSSEFKYAAERVLLILTYLSVYFLISILIN